MACMCVCINRPDWAETRNKYFSDGINRKNLEMIEKAAFFITLDDNPQYHCVSSIIIIQPTCTCIIMYMYMYTLHDCMYCTCTCK